MAGLDVTSVYRAVIDDVVTRSRPEFVQEGVDEAVLEELRVLWEEKLQQSGVLAPEPARPMPGGIPGSQVIAAPYAQPPGQHVPSYYPVRAPQPGQPGIGQPQPYMVTSAPWQPQQPQTSSVAAAPVVQTGAHYAAARPVGQPYAYAQQALAAAGKQGVPAVQGGAPQQPYHRQQPAGAYQQAAPAVQAAGPSSSAPDSRKRPAEASQWAKFAAIKYEQQQHQQQLQQQQQQQRAGPHIPQQDGPADEGKDPADGGEAAAEAAVDNLSDVPSSDEEEGDVPNHCISQFTKVQRTKNRWKCQLTAGVLHLNGRDHVFQSATGEFQF